jgi:hypothetical protein
MLTSAALHIGKMGKRAEFDRGAAAALGLEERFRGSQKGIGINPTRFPPTLTFGAARST